MTSNNLSELFETKTFPATTKVCSGRDLVCSCLVCLQLCVEYLQHLKLPSCAPQHILGFNKPDDLCAP